MVFEQFVFWLGVVVQVSGDGQSQLVQCLLNIAFMHFSPEFTWIVSYQSVKNAQRGSTMLSQSEDVYSQVTTEDNIPDSI
jgi:hypothetical protein